MNDEMEKNEDDAPLNAAEEAVEFGKTLLFAIVFALIIRMFFFEPFNIPSGSMKPTLLEGDYLITNKMSYGYGQYSLSLFFNVHLPAPYGGRIFESAPERGDIAVFFIPKLGDNYIKRVIGLPGDTLQVKAGRLYINGERAPREFVGIREEGGHSIAEYVETLPNGVTHSIYEISDDFTAPDGFNVDNTPEYTIPKGHYFMMGDNRDQSQDSRFQDVVGYVPVENFVGKAIFLFFSHNGSAHLYEPWKWPWAIRYSRLFNWLGN